MIVSDPVKISVVTAVYNRAATVGDTLSTVSFQDYPLVEHIVQDGGSNDGTLDTIAGHPNTSALLMSEHDRGIYDAINKGMSRATGDVVGLLHSDDVFADEGVLSRVAEAFADPDIDCIYGDLQYVSASDTTRVIRHWTSGPFNRSNLKRGWMPPHPTFYIRRQLLERHGGYDTSFEIAADYDAMLRWLWCHRLRPAYLPGVMVKMRMGGESNRSLGRILCKSREDYRALRRNGVGGIGTLALKNLSKINQFKPSKTQGQ
ncbi:glycosyltransferase family 2 protein [Loktanella sp. PT4BL]|uniref:glycosyltransferase family 2 protein n=1 Tax=Loktanella sp. PT4BL TaxID=2135611 RepID=UPI002570D222|nr:glycosyltransferase family 2 protein [Loktanella sp. PT4BL]